MQCIVYYKYHLYILYFDNFPQVYRPLKVPRMFGPVVCKRISFRIFLKTKGWAIFIDFVEIFTFWFTGERYALFRPQFSFDGMPRVSDRNPDSSSFIIWKGRSNDLQLLFSPSCFSAVNSIVFFQHLILQSEDESLCVSLLSTPMARSSVWSCHSPTSLFSACFLWGIAEGHPRPRTVDHPGILKVRALLNALQAKTWHARCSHSTGQNTGESLNFNIFGWY